MKNSFKKSGLLVVFGLLTNPINKPDYGLGFVNPLYIGVTNQPTIDQQSIKIIESEKSNQQTEKLL